MDSSTLSPISHESSAEKRTHPLAPDLTAAQRFIKMLCGKSTVTWQTFSDQKRVPDSNSKIIHGTSPAIFEKLASLQARGAGVFIMINEGNGLGRNNNAVVRVQSLFLDLDGAPLEPVLDCPVMPQIIVESSAGRFHCYWMLTDCNLEQFKSLQQALARRFNGDRSICDLARVMRVPGFWHLKNPSKPFQSRILKIIDIPHYTVEELVNGLDLEYPHDNTLSPCGQADQPAETIFTCIDPCSGELVDLKQWAKKFAGFKLATALQKRVPEKVLGAKQNGKLHICCVNEERHSSPGEDKATFVMDSQDSETSGFVYHCRHDHCTGLDRLVFIRMMLEKGWLSWADLTSKSFNIITEHKHPKFVQFDADDILGRLQYLPSVGDRQLTVMLGIHSLQKCYSGQLPNHERKIAALLGVTVDAWEKLKGQLIDLEIITATDSGIIVSPFHLIYETAAQLYVRAAISGSRGGNAARHAKT